MSCGIYQIVNTINGKKYVGSSQNIQKRWRSEHRYFLRKNKHCNRHLQAAWNKYGGSVFDLQVLEYCQVEDLFIIEQYYLDWLTPFGDQGYNLSKFAEPTPKGWKHSDESKKKMRGPKNHLFGKSLPEATKKKISDALRGRKHKPMSEQQKKQHSITMKGRPSPNKGRKMSEHVKEKISKSLQGNIPWNKGKPMGEQQKEKLRKPRKCRFCQQTGHNQLTCLQLKNLSCLETRICNAT
jgi:group I intron endonuclease